MEIKSKDHLEDRRRRLPRRDTKAMERKPTTTTPHQPRTAKRSESGESDPPPTRLLSWINTKTDKRAPIRIIHPKSRLLTLPCFLQPRRNTGVSRRQKDFIPGAPDLEIRNQSETLGFQTYRREKEGRGKSNDKIGRGRRRATDGVTRDNRRRKRSSRSVCVFFFFFPERDFLLSKLKSHQLN